MRNLGNPTRRIEPAGAESGAGWHERIATGAAVAAGVIIVALIAVLMGMA